MVQIKVKVNKPVKNNVILAQFATDIKERGGPNGNRLAMPSRFTGRLHTGVEAQVPSTHCLRVALVPDLSSRGLIMTNSGRFTVGEIYVDVLNAGREIVSVKDGDPLLEVWLEKVEKFVWETE